MDDIDFVKQLKDGDEEAFRLLLDKYQHFVLNSCYKFVLNKETAEDLTQDVFIEVYKSVSLFREDSKLSTWIYRIAVSKSLDYIKKQNRKKRFSVFRSLFGEDELENTIPSENKSNPDSEIENEDRVKVLKWALSKLPENQRVAFTLSKYDEMSYSEISEILGTSVSSVESMIHRAKENLKKKLYHYYKKHL